MGSWRGTPGVKVRVQDAYGKEYVAFMDEVADRFETTEATVRSWCTGMSNCPHGYSVSYAEIVGKGRDTRTPNERRAQIKQAKANYRRMVERRKELYGDERTSLSD